jgi:hypothetical protein
MAIADTAVITTTLTYYGDDQDFVRLYSTVSATEPPVKWRITRYTTIHDGDLRGFTSPSGATEVLFDDYEIYGGLLQYYVGVTFSDGSLAYKWFSIDIPDEGRPDWLKDPSRPDTNIVLNIESFSPMSSERSLDYGYAHDAKNPVMSVGARRGRKWVIKAFTITDEERERLLTIMEAPRTLMLSSSKRRIPEGRLWVVVNMLSESRISNFGETPERRWEMEVIETGPPTKIELGSTRGVTWQDVYTNPAYPTWSALLTTRTSWLEVLEQG